MAKAVETLVRCIQIGLTSLLRQCQEFECPFPFQTMGALGASRTHKCNSQTEAAQLANERPVEMVRLGKKLAGRILEGTTWDEVPHTPLIHA